MLGGGENNGGDFQWNHRQMPQVTSRTVLEFEYKIMLAQAQECILEKSMMDGRKSLIIGTSNNNNTNNIYLIKNVIEILLYKIYIFYIKICRGGPK